MWWWGWRTFSTNLYLSLVTRHQRMPTLIKPRTSPIDVAPVKVLLGSFSPPWHHVQCQSWGCVSSCLMIKQCTTAFFSLFSAEKGGKMRAIWVEKMLQCFFLASIILPMSGSYQGWRLSPSWVIRQHHMCQVLRANVCYEIAFLQRFCRCPKWMSAKALPSQQGLSGRPLQTFVDGELRDRRKTDVHYERLLSMQFEFRGQANVRCRILFLKGTHFTPPMYIPYWWDFRVLLFPPTLESFLVLMALSRVRSWSFFSSNLLYLVLIFNQSESPLSAPWT